MAQRILLITHHHFDPTWRRCFDRDAEYNGVVVRSYAEIEDLVLSAWLQLADRGWTCSEGQAAVWRKYIERNPEKLDEIRRRIETGNCTVMFGGETVQDTNLPAAEGLIRNYLISLPLYRLLCGEDSDGMKVGWQEDAFGNSPNYPQVLKGVGIEYAARLSYRSVDDSDVWVGIDGSKIPHDRRVPEHIIGGFEKHPPCPACKGRGCNVCDETGIVAIGFDAENVRGALVKAIESDEPTKVVYVFAEELIPTAEICDVVDELNATYAGKSKIEYSTYLDELDLYRERFASAVEAQDDMPNGDLNPAMPGCMVTRIKVKQRLRDITYKLIQAESRLARDSWAAGKPGSSTRLFEKAWQDVAFVQFHDAVTGTHIDSAYVEIMDMLDNAESVARAHLPTNAKNEEPAWVEVTEPGLSSLDLGAIDVRFDRKGIAAISPGDGSDLHGTFGAFRTRRALRIAELTIEEDFGDAWGQRMPPFTSPTGNVGRILLGEYHTRVEIAPHGIRWHGEYTGGDPRISKLTWTTTATSPDGRRLDFVADVDWDTHSRRLRVVVPIASDETSATYEVPFGHCDRVYDESKLDFGQWRADQREFPTLHWGRKSIDDQSGVALLNKGLPCNRWLPGAWDISLLRSPEAAFCANENGHYEFPDIDGQRDTGQHRFEYSIWPYTTALSPGELTRTGYEYNNASPKTPFEIDGDVVVTAFKEAEDGGGWILRLQDASGQGTDCTVRFGRQVRVCSSDLLERPTSEVVAIDTWQVAIHKHGIATLRIAP